MTSETARAKTKKGNKGIAMEGLIATWYARNTRSRIGEQKALAERIAARVPRGGRVLEIAPGPGYLSIELAKLGTCRGSALDISRCGWRPNNSTAARVGWPSTSMCRCVRTSAAGVCGCSAMGK